MRRSSAERSLQACTHSGRAVRTVPSGTIAGRDLAGEQLLAPGVPPLVEHAPVRVDPLGGDVVGRVHGAEGEVQEEGLAWRALLLVLHHADGLVGQVLAQVVPVLGPARRLDVVVVADQVRCPVVGVALEEAVVALETEAERPGVEGPRRRALPTRRQVPFAHGQRGVPGVAQEPGEGGGGLRQPGVVARERPRGMSARKPIPTAWWLRPVKNDALVGEHSEVTWKRLKRRAAGRQPVQVGRPDVGAERAQVAEAGVVEHDGDDVGRARRRLGFVGEARRRLGRGEADLLRLVHGSRG